MKKILIVDDDAEFRRHLTEVLEEAGYQTACAVSASEAYDRLRSEKFDIGLIDFMMPQKSGIDALFDIKRLQPNIKLIMITAFASVDNAVEAIKRGASEYIAKPFKIESLLLTIRRVLEEAKFAETMKNLDIDRTMSALASPIRRNILKLLQDNDEIRLMEITRKLEIEDHTKVVFHLKILKEAAVIDQSQGKGYFLTKEGLKMIECLNILDQYLTS